ncbi:MAG: hypothetical protein PHP86_16510 [Nevskiales bacterium]|nr:hypothetical protein [Nevskiales bacterium]
MNTAHLKLCAWTGPAFVLLFLIGYVLILAMPPVSPELGADAVAQFYFDNRTQIRFGVIVMMLAAMFFAPFMAAVVVLMSRMGNASPALMLTFAIVCGGVVMGLYILLISLAAATYRPLDFPEITRAFHDFAFMLLLWPGSIVTILALPVAIATLADTRTTPVFPRWYGFFGYWVALLAPAGALIVFFKSGPFSMTGILGFWISLGIFFLWLAVTAALIPGAAQRESRQA